MIDNVLNAFRIPDLRRKLLYTIGLLLVFRVVAHIPVPGVDLAKLRDLFANNQLLGLLNLFSGGALQTFSVAAMGVYPYITASIIMQLLMPLIPQLEALSKEGEMGRNKLNQYTRIMTVPLAFLQGFGQVSLLQRSNVLTNFNLFNKDTFLPSFALLVALTAGTMLLVWIGELITENGVGNGISLIIFAGIVARLPQGIGQSIVSGTSGTNIMGLAVFGIIGLATIVGIVVIQEGQRRIPVQYSKRIRGTRMYQGQSTHIPLKVNSAGMIPLIFALSIMIFPGTIASYFQASSNATVANFAGGVVNFFNSQTGLAYWVLYFVLTVAHGGHVPTAEPAGEPAEERRVHSGHPARPADRRVPEQGAEPHHAGGRPLPRDRGHPAVLRPVRHEHSEPGHQQHRLAHRCGRGAGHHEAA